ncbi:MAG: nucleotide-diphospho-sugar transferase [Phycisphaeraceae bacterium]|nr:nucleotide-diphospho-sugar transferase [Phycisphaeraceae bacterium]
MLFCTHEDRPEALAGIKLLALSLRRHCPQANLVVSYPQPDDEFVRWCAKHDVRVLSNESWRHAGWNIKPSLLRHLLDEGHEAITWIDADIALAGALPAIMRGLDADTLLVSQVWAWDYFPGGTVRTALWNLEPGRALAGTASSGVVRATSAHRELLEAWQELLEAPAYLGAQARPVSERPIHMIGDQDVLTALLGSRRFGTIPLAWLDRRRDIVLCVGPAGYTAGQRLGHRRSTMPPLIHGAEPKYWEASTSPTLLRRPRDYYWRVCLETSPYAWVARQYRDELGDEVAWADARTTVGRLLATVTGDHPALAGLPQALFHGIGKRIKKMLGITAWPDAHAHVDP